MSVDRVERGQELKAGEHNAAMCKIVYMMLNGPNEHMGRKSIGWRSGRVRKGTKPALLESAGAM